MNTIEEIMITLTRHPDNHQNAIQAYEPGKIRIAETIYQRSVIVSATQLITDWPPQQYATLTSAHLQPLLDLAPHMVILGTGQQHQLPVPDYLQRFLCANIRIDIMSTAAACRTFNILLSEQRDVVAALLIQ